jgi:hypothetical protein
MNEAVEKAIEDLMRSPQHHPRKSLAPNSSQYSASVLGHRASVPATNRDSKLYSSIDRITSGAVATKSGAVISKCFNMLCGNCGKRFTSK